MIIICGATGKIGGTALRQLRARGQSVTAVVRDPTRADVLREQGCTLAVANLQDQEALTRAFRGADSVLVIVPLVPTSSDVASDAQRTIEVLAASLEAARPRSVVAISDYGAHVPSETGITTIFRRLEQRLRDVPSAMTFLRSAEHMQNWARQVRSVKTRGVVGSLHHPVTRPFPMVSTFDVGLVAAELLAAPPTATSTTPRVIHVEGPRPYSASDVAAVFGQRLGRPATAVELPREQWASMLTAGGLSESYAQLVVQLQDAHNAGSIEAEPGGEVRRGTTELATALGELPALKSA
jgi:NAD(P)H dehydrogenase (quinone)